jgi:hypothetical protein
VKRAGQLSAANEHLSSATNTIFAIADWFRKSFPQQVSTSWDYFGTIAVKMLCEGPTGSHVRVVTSRGEGRSDVFGDHQEGLDYYSDLHSVSHFLFKIRRKE